MIVTVSPGEKERDFKEEGERVMVESVRRVGADVVVVMVHGSRGVGGVVVGGEAEAEAEAGEAPPRRMVRKGCSTEDGGRTLWELAAR
jgi:hypothetical protein